MNENVQNLYKTGRVGAGMTQEQAAELLHISVKTLSEYENGHTRPHNDTVLAMTKVYGCPYLGYSHLQSDPLGKDTLPALREPETNNCAVVQVLNAKNTLEQVSRKFMKLTRGKARLDDLCENDRERLAKNIDPLMRAIGEMVGANMYKRKIAHGDISVKRKEPPRHGRPKTAT